MSEPYYSDDLVTLYHGDCREVLLGMDGRSIDAVITDPPYNIGKAEWDVIPEYLDWSRLWIGESARVLADNGAFWMTHSEPLVLADLVRLVERHGRALVSWITLDKSSWGIAKRYKNAGTKTFPASAEYAAYLRREVYASQIRECRERAGLTRAEFDTLVSPSGKPTGITYRWEHGERIPQPTEVAAIEREFGTKIDTPTFHNTDKFSCVWDFPQADTADHPTAKPLGLTTRMVRATTDPGGLILDPFAGSGTTLVAAVNEGRHAVGVELEERYCEVIAKRLSNHTMTLDFGGVR
ncbi:DNA-methyltransferase [Gordonia alkanivorans]|uniref:DNA-methyltransferase n=1 Tax=Gordonia alkanivorans TaxID=84096 RepID=UPI0024B7CCE3|nr:site-specific DNA-methyltransferase [Gordonia alkanivorans]MDJ0010127.1 site-specific DNA-methyltransferase [Gordonia alkanivorans]MDJ0495683.1 site-specific DNA-methyltransferase [Gordonia alkanivorans]